MKKVVLLITATVQLVAGAFACENTTGPLLAPVDPVAWGTVNADWGPYSSNGQMDSLRKVVNGQITAHQVNCSFTCPACRSVMRVKCFDPANCVVCSKEAAEFGKSVRNGINATNGNAQASQASIASAAKKFLASQEELRARMSIDNKSQTETVTELSPEGEVRGKSIIQRKIASESDVDRQKRADEYRKAAQMLDFAASSQAQAGGTYFYNACNDVVAKLKKPESSTVLFAGDDPVN